LNQILIRFGLRAFEISEIELEAIAAPAMMGLNKMPKTATSYFAPTAYCERELRGQKLC